MALLVLISLTAVADSTTKDEAAGLWLKLSARTQNVAWQLQKLSPSGQSDPSLFTKDLKAIDSLLGKLVKRGSLVEAKVNFRPPNELGDDGFKRLMEFVEVLAEDHGHYVALELMDLGLRARLSAMQPDKPLELKLRLPPERLKEIQALAARNGILQNNKAE